MTIIEQIKAEIERRKMESIGFRNNEKREDWASFFNGEATALENLLSFLSTLESEKPMDLELTDEQLDKEVELWYNEYAGNLRFDWIGFARHFAQWGAEHLATSGKTLEIKPGDEVTINGHKIVYDKDKGYVTIVKSEESVPKDLEEAAEKHLDTMFGRGKHHQFYKDLFIAGAKWQAEQFLKSLPLPEDTVLFNKGVEEGKRLMMEEAVEGEVVKDWDNNLSVKSGVICGFKFGEKVRVIVLPKED